MIPVLNLLLDIDLKLNTQASVEHQAIHNENKIVALNQAQIKLIKKKINPNNIYQLGFDSFAKRYEDLQALVVPYVQLTTTSVGDKLNSYIANISSLPTAKKYFMPVDIYVLADQGCCKNRILNVLDIVKHGDLTRMLNEDNWSPNFACQETLVTISENKINVYSDSENSFTINSLYLSYLRYPVKIDVAGYIHLDGSASVDTDCELPDYLEDELVDLAVQELAMATENQNAVNYSIQRNKENE